MANGYEYMQPTSSYNSIEKKDIVQALADFINSSKASNTTLPLAGSLTNTYSSIGPGIGNVEGISKTTFTGTITTGSTIIDNTYVPSTTTGTYLPYGPYTTIPTVSIPFIPTPQSSTDYGLDQSKMVLWMKMAQDPELMDLIGAFITLYEEKKKHKQAMLLQAKAEAQALKEATEAILNKQKSEPLPDRFIDL